MKRLTARTLRRCERREIQEALDGTAGESSALADARARREAREEAELAAYLRYERFLFAED